MLKVNKGKIILIIITVYILICVVTNMYYEKILLSKIGYDKIIFSVFKNAILLKMKDILNIQN